MPNGRYGRYVPRLAGPVAEYRAPFGEWPTDAHGPGVMVIIEEPGEGSDPSDFYEYSPEIAQRVRSRLICHAEGRLIEVSGPAGRCGFGLVGSDRPEFWGAYKWLYGEFQ
jgi:hypothetical protein